MVEMIQGWIGLVAPFWPWAKAIVLALLFSWGITQLVKFIWRSVKGAYQYKPRVEIEKLYLRLLASATCYYPLYVLWPDRDDAIWWAVTLALLSPGIYSIVTGYAYMRWPSLEGWLSAAPPVTIKRDKAGNIVGIKQGDDPTETIPRNK